MTRAYVGLGSNLGDREATLRAAVDALAATPGVEVVAVSTLVDTEPVGYLDQPRFLNGVAVLETDLEARTLLGAAARDRGPLRARPGGRPAAGPADARPRPPALRGRRDRRGGPPVPHPRLHERAFVLEPLQEVAPGLEVPGMGSVEAILARLH